MLQTRVVRVENVSISEPPASAATAVPISLDQIAQVKKLNIQFLQLYQKWFYYMLVFFHCPFFEIIHYFHNYINDICMDLEIWHDMGLCFDHYNDSSPSSGQCAD